MLNDRTPIFIVAGSGGLETSAAFTGSGFTSGEVGVFVQSTGANVGAALSTSENPFFWAKKSSDNTKFTIRTSPIDGKRVTRLAKKTYSAPVAMTWTAGYDGVSSAGLSYTCDTDYGIKVIAYSSYIRKYYNNLGFVQTYVIHTDCCDDCAGCTTSNCYTETAKFVKNINDTPQAGILSRFVYGEILTDNSANDTVAVFTDASTMTLTLGSKVVTTSAANTLAAGNYIRVSNTATVQPADTDPVYKIASVESTTSFTLDTPWQRATVTRTLDTTLVDSDVTLVTLAGVTKCGIKFTGQLISSSTGCCCFPPFPFDYEGVSFMVTEDTFVSFPCSWVATKGTELSYGRGDYRSMLYEEMDAHGYTDIRQWFVDCASNTNYSSNLVSTDTYDVYYLEWDQAYATTPGSGNSIKQNNICIFAITNATPGIGGVSTTATNMDTIFASIASFAGINVT